VLPEEFVDRFAIIGDVDTCVKRLQELVGLGLERLVITGPSFGAIREDAQLHTHLMTTGVLPALRQS
jgi:anaerobic glycerol-3-phosphate dehydrogenase